jgi:hypothetical protein
LIIILALNAAFALIYLLGPNLEQRFVCVTPGCLTGTACLLMSSIAFKGLRRQVLGLRRPVRGSGRRDGAPRMAVHRGLVDPVWRRAERRVATQNEIRSD